MAKAKLSGSLYQRNGRWWWKVRLPGRDKNEFLPLKPDGGKFATKDKSVAEHIARDIWTKALSDSAKKEQGQCSRIVDLIKLYNDYAKTYYCYEDNSPTSEVSRISIVTRYLSDFCGMESPESFGPLKLQEFRQKLIERNLSRKYINGSISIIKRMFRWAASKELIPVITYRALTTVDGLRRGRSAAKEPDRIKPVAESNVYKVLPYTSKVISTMIRLQLLTGMRSTELCIMRPRDIETSGKIWLYRPSHHKNAWRGHDRVIAIGPQGQKILKPFLKRKITDYCFTPQESLQQREKGGKAAQPHYDRCSYRRAVKYAITAAKEAGKKVVSFTPHQLRHTVATKIRKEMGIEAAGTARGDISVDVVEIYAERNLELACKVARKFG